MRITNKIINNNSLYNINNNKVAEDEVNTQMATGKKIARPSDDPVIAIRALRLRSTVTQLDQYYNKNAKDAKSWMDVTEDALSTVTDVLTDTIQQVNRGANKDLTLSDLNTIITQLNALSKEYYSTGNVDYAGRYVFTGFRTDTTLSYDKATTESFKDIEDEFVAGDISKSIRTLNLHQLDAGDVLDYKQTQITDPKDFYNATTEREITQLEVGRIRLSYDNLDYTESNGKSAELRYRENLEQPATSSITNTDLTYFSLTMIDETGVEQNAYIPLSTDYSVTVGNYRYEAEMAQVGKPEKGYIITASQVNDPYNIYQFEVSSDGVLVDGDGDGEIDLPDNVQQAMVSMHTASVTTLTYGQDGKVETVSVPLLGPVDQRYEIEVDNGFTAVVNGDGTFTLTREAEKVDDYGNNNRIVLEVTDNGSIYSSYKETTIRIDNSHIIYSTTPEGDDGSGKLNIDDAYRDLKGANISVEKPEVPDQNADKYKNTVTGEFDNDLYDQDYQEYLVKYKAYLKEYEEQLKEYHNTVYLNAKTGEVLLNDELKEKLSALPFITNAKTIDIVYDKKEWQQGDIRPQNLFACVDNNGVIYNGGSAPHDIAYDVGYAQKIVVNTTATSVFTTDIKRDVFDLEQIANKINVVNTTITTLKDKLEELTDAEEKKVVQQEIDACQKSLDYLRQNIQEEFEHKITSIQAALDRANVAVTDNGTRSKRLELINSRLQDQTTTFKTLQSDNEDADLAETATNLATAQLTYQAALMATGKISKDSLMNYI